jgi:hypothetical protein
MRHEVFGDRVATLAASVLFCRECGCGSWCTSVILAKKKETCAGFFFCFKNSKPSKTQINRESSLWRLSLCVPQTLLYTQTRSRTWGWCSSSLAHTHKKGKFTWSCNLLSLQILELTKYEKCDASRGEVTNECYSLYIWPLDFYIIIIIVRRNFYLFGLRCTTLSRWYVVVMFNVRTIF